MTDTVTLPDGQVRLIANASESEIGPSGSLPAKGEIGSIGLGHMGTAMAGNLAAAGYRVIAYGRRPDQMDKLAALGLDPTTQVADLFDCWVQGDRGFAKALAHRRRRHLSAALARPQRTRAPEGPLLGRRRRHSRGGKLSLSRGPHPWRPIT
jgi:hypothetical protein